MAEKSLHGYSIKQKIYLTLGLLFAFMLVASATYTSISQRDLVEHMVENQTHIMADTYFDSINTLMLTGGMDNREIPRQKLLLRPEVLDARIIRSEVLSKIYGEGTEYAKAVDEYDRRGLQGEYIKEFREGEEGRVLTMVVPMEASSDSRGVNCIMCHPAEEGEILGAIRMDYSLKALDAEVMQDLTVNILMNSILMIGGLIGIGVLIARVVTTPLATLTEKMRSVAEGTANFRDKISIDSRDEMGRLAGLFNQATARFAGIIDETHRQSQENLRVKRALDSNSTATTMSDSEGTLIYMNHAANQQFESMQSLWKQDFAEFSVEKLLGGKIGNFMPKGELRELYSRKLDQEVVLDG